MSERVILTDTSTHHSKHATANNRHKSANWTAARAADGVTAHDPAHHRTWDAIPPPAKRTALWNAAVALPPRDVYERAVLIYDWMKCQSMPYLA